VGAQSTVGFVYFRAMPTRESTRGRSSKAGSAGSAWRTSIQQGQDVDVAKPSPTTVVVAANGTGTGALIGQFSFTQVTTVNFANNTSAGSGQWIAANGDSIYTTIAGSGYFMASGLIRITEIHTVTSGTGRFTGAQESFTLVRVADILRGHSPARSSGPSLPRAQLTENSYIRRRLAPAAFPRPK